MLILSRRESESLKIGDDITITIHEIQGGRVRIGISAPKNISIMRTELLQIAEQNKEAVNTTSVLAVKNLLLPKL